MKQVQIDHQTLKVSGKIDYETAERVYHDGILALKSVRNWPIVIDLVNAEQGNTLLLAIILQWLKQCPSIDSIKIGQMPPKMKGIIEASHLEHLVVA